VSPAQLHYAAPKSPLPQTLSHVAVPAITNEELDMIPTAPKRVKEPADQAQDDKMPYDLLLLILSEEYLDAAHALGPRVALIPDEGASDEDMELFEAYSKLIASSMGCLEAALKVFYVVCCSITLTR
jgi:hypothetical protein